MTLHTADVLAVLDETLAAVERHGRSDQVPRLSALRRRLARPPRHVVVLGEFNKGKSSLVNALLNARLCPTDADIATAVPSFVRYGERLRVRALADDVSPVDGPGGREVDVTTAARGAVGELPDVRALDVQVPRRLLRDGLVLVDTPGLGGGLASGHAAAALRALSSSASVAVVVSDASAEYRVDELELVRAVAAECPRVLCVLTKTDVHPHWRRVAEADRAHLARAGVRSELLPVSSALRRAGLDAADRDLLVESGFPALAARITALAEQGAAPLATEAAAAARTVVGQLVTLLVARREVLAGRADATAEARSWQAEERLAADLQSASARWQQVLSERTADLAPELDRELRLRFHGLAQEAAARIAELVDVRGSAGVGPWLQRRTNEELLDHVRVVRAEAERLADTVAEEFGEAARHLRAGVAVDVPRVLGDTALEVEFRDVGRRLRGGEAGVAAIRSGATGIVLGNAVGVAFSVTMPVVAPAAVALSAVLAGKAWRSARDTQERQVRLELQEAVAAYLREVEGRARPDAQAAVRRLHRQLRDAFGQRARDLHEAAVDAARQLREAERQVEGRRAAELTALEEEVEQLRRLHARCGRLVSAGLAAAGGAR